jgi:hypothetical protein
LWWESVLSRLAFGTRWLGRSIVHNYYKPDLVSRP